jgi:hypothetical protein
VSAVNYEPKPEGVFIACPQCMVCSIKLSQEEVAAVDAGQCMIEVCQVCGATVNVHEARALC